GRLFGTDGLSARVAYLNQNLVPDAPGVQALLPEAQSVRLVDVPGVRGDYLAMTGESTWADVERRSLQGHGRATFDPARDPGRPPAPPPGPGGARCPSPPSRAARRGTPAAAWSSSATRTSSPTCT